MGRGGAGLWPLLERSTAAKRPQPCHGAGASSTRTTPWYRQRCFQLLGSERGCALEDAPAPAALIQLAPASITGEAQRPFGAVGCATAPSNFIPPLCSVVFSITPSTALHRAFPAWQDKLLPVSPQKARACTTLDAGCWMWDASLQSLPSSKSRRDCCPYVQWQGVHRSPTWPRSHQKIQCYKDAPIHTYSLKNREPSLHL